MMATAEWWTAWALAWGPLDFYLLTLPTSSDCDLGKLLDWVPHSKRRQAVAAVCTCDRAGLMGLDMEGSEHR